VIARPTPLFLLSLPRSGSTLAQRILAAHEGIATTSEPWILLPYLYTLRDSGIYAEYNHRSMILAIEDFCEMLPGGREDYIAEIRELALRLYDKACPDGTRYFLDKTPRYHLVSDEILAKSWCRRYLLWIGRDRLAIMGYDLDDLVADLDSLPTSYRRVGSDVGRGCWGVVRVESHPRTQVAGWRS
jgi:hypothetical protein